MQNNLANTRLKTYLLFVFMCLESDYLNLKISPLKLKKHDLPN